LADFCRWPVFDTVMDGVLRLVIVVERAGAVVAMAYTHLLRVEDLTHRDYLPLGRYANIAEVGVRTEQRGQGVGRALVQGVFDAYAAVQIDGYVLKLFPGEVATPGQPCSPLAGCGFVVSARLCKKRSVVMQTPAFALARPH
jgi:GNAT superfamily N-acetyltransferase